MAKFELDQKEVTTFLELVYKPKTDNSDPPPKFSSKFFENLLKLKQYCTKKLEDISEVEQT